MDINRTEPVGSCRCLVDGFSTEPLRSSDKLNMQERGRHDRLHPSLEQ
jgi:hypothetical protein